MSHQCCWKTRHGSGLVCSAACAALTETASRTVAERVPGFFRGKSLKTGANSESQKIIAPRHALPRIALRGAVTGKILRNAALARF